MTTLLQRFEILSRVGDNKFRWVNTNEFIGEYACLAFNNGGTWTRKENIGKYWKIITVKENGTFRYPGWTPSTEEKHEINSDFYNHFTPSKRGNRIQYIKIHGPNENNIQRTINSRIKNYFIENNMMKCVVCGSCSDLQYDHKNDLYNDPRVLNVNTQEVDDFQILCRHCNDQKRNCMVKTRNTGKRYGATRIPQLAYHGIDFIEGDETFDVNDINAMKGTYWYDPVEFMKFLFITKM